jgi:hypothetical protein
VTCPQGSAVRVAGDVPGAISYDIYRHMQPLTPTTLARLTKAQQVWMIPDGTLSCTIDDDGVAAPSAVLIQGPGGQMNYWVRRRNLRPAGPGTVAE